MLAIILLVIGLIGLYFGVVGIRRWYPENAAGTVTGATQGMMLGGFFVATVGLLGGGAALFLH